MKGRVQRFTCVSKEDEDRWKEEGEDVTKQVTNKRKMMNVEEYDKTGKIKYQDGEKED